MNNKKYHRKDYDLVCECFEELDDPLPIIERKLLDHIDWLRKRGDAAEELVVILESAFEDISGHLKTYKPKAHDNFPAAMAGIRKRIKGIGNYIKDYKDRWVSRKNGDK